MRGRGRESSGPSRAASCVKLNRCRPKVAACTRAISRARSSAAAREAPTISVSAPEGRPVMNAIACRRRSAAADATITEPLIGRAPPETGEIGSVGCRRSEAVTRARTRDTLWQADRSVNVNGTPSQTPSADDHGLVVPVARDSAVPGDVTKHPCAHRRPSESGTPHIIPHDGDRTGHSPRRDVKCPMCARHTRSDPARSKIRTTYDQRDRLAEPLRKSSPR